MKERERERERERKYEGKLRGLTILWMEITEHVFHMEGKKFKDLERLKMGRRKSRTRNGL